MKKVQGIRITGLILAVLLILSIFAGCGMQSASTSEAAPAATTSDNKVSATDAASYGDGNGAENQAEPAKADSLASGSNPTQDINNAILAERKIIRSANVTIEVDNFDEAYGKINNFILGIGFIQETNINSERTYVDNQQKLIKRGTIVLRVDKTKFDRVLNNVKGIGDVYNWTINGEDVTDKYIDTESRLRLLRLEEARLEDYLKKLTDLDQIFKTETRITELMQEIENLTGNLKKLGDLVDLATITINLNEKTPDYVKPPETYGQRLVENMLGSLKGVTKFLGELLIILVAALPVLILLGVLAFIIVVIYRKVSRRNGKRPARSAETRPTANKAAPVGQADAGTGADLTGTDRDKSEK